LCSTGWDRSNTILVLAGDGRTRIPSISVSSSDAAHIPGAINSKGMPLAITRDMTVPATNILQTGLNTLMRGVLIINLCNKVRLMVSAMLVKGRNRLSVD
jgi:hypothetical protein